MEKKFVKLANGETYAYVEKGKGDLNLILIHGNFSSSLYYIPLFDRLPDSFHAYAMDLRGYGDSTYNKRITSLKDYADDVALFMEKLAIGRAFIVGWSLGGGVAMEFAAFHQKKTEKLILISSTTHKGYPVFKKDATGKPIPGAIYASPEEMATDPVQVKPLYDAQKSGNFDFVKYIFDLTVYTVGKPDPKTNQIYITESLKQKNLPDADYALAIQNMSHAANPYRPGEGTIDRISCPTLHIWGDRDITVPEAMVKDNLAAIKSESTYIKYENCGHSPLVDKPDELMQAIIDFAN